MCLLFLDLRDPFPDKLSMDRTGCERSELQRFCCKYVLLRRYGSFNGFIVLRRFELLMSAEKFQKLTKMYALSLSKSQRVLVPA